jgi:hypothetical protein
MPGRNRRTQPGAHGRQRSRWTEPQTLIALAALITSVIAIVIAQHSAQSGKASADISQKEAARGSVLDVAAVSAHLGNDLSGESVPLGDDRPTKLTNLVGPKIDVTLKNRGSGDALLTSATVTTLRSEDLPACVAMGGSEGVAANYDFPVDAEAQPPFTATKDNLRFVVPSGEHERLTLTVGPVSASGIMGAWAGVVTVSLHDSDGKDIELGPFGLASPGETNIFTFRDGRWSIQEQKDAHCMEANAETVRDLAELDGLVPAPEFTALYDALRTYLPR